MFHVKHLAWCALFVGDTLLIVSRETIRRLQYLSIVELL